MIRLVYITLICMVVCILLSGHTDGQSSPEPLCPPQELILPCRCTQKGVEVQVWCSHSDLPRVLAGIKAVSKYVKQPIDEMVLENNRLLSLPNRFFSPLQIIRLMLRNNDVERLAPAWLNELENSLVEIFIVEKNLRSLPVDSLLGCRSLRAVTIQSDHIKRAPSFARLPMLRYIKIESANLAELPPYGLANLGNLETVRISESYQLTEIKQQMFENLEQLKTLNLNNNRILWIHLHAFINLPFVHTVDLSGNQITDAGMIGRAVKDLFKLEYLRLDHNNITHLNEGSFVDLPSLKELYLNDNAISEIHYGAFHKTPRLRIIHFENNSLKRIHPDSFFHSSGNGVEFMHVQHNNIGDIEEVKSLLDALPMLKFIDLSYNKLEVIPFGVLRGHATVEQIIFDHNWIRLIEQDAFIAMPALRELRLRNNSLSENGIMPYWNLPSLKGLDLSHNKFTILNRLIFLGLPSLRRLDVSHNKIHAIDYEVFGKNGFLETINLSANELTDIDAKTLSDLNHLFEIDASDNRLESFIAGLPPLIERVNLQGNQIAQLPNASWLALPNLRALNIGSNQLNEIPGDSFSNLRKLRTLILDDNRLKTIDEHSFNGLANLETLYLQNNNLINLNERSLASLANLRNLNLQGNHLEILSNNILVNPQLKTFDASRNNLVEIQEQFFARTLRLLSLDLSENRLRDLPQSMIALRDLKDVDISYNRLTHISSDIVSAWHILEEFRASSNNITELPEKAFNDLVKLQYLDLSNNNIKFINAESIKNLPKLQELVLANNQLVELNDHPFHNLPNLQALHLQSNQLRYISPEAFRGSNALVYFNLSHNQFVDLEHMGLHNTRNLEVLDISFNKVRRVSTNPLRLLEWLVELKLDNNQICRIQGVPFASMPRLKVLNLMNNRIASIDEQTFGNLRGNLAFLDMDDNPLECSCDLLWLHAWYKQTNSYPGPHCRDGGLLIEQHLSKADCTASADNRLNQVLLTNDHGDVFKRQLSMDECDNIPYEHENLPSSPTESDYFEHHFVDFPNGDTDPNYHHPDAPSNFNRTLLHYNQHKHHMQHQRPNGGGSAFTFFGYPLPSLSNLWGGSGSGGEARKSTSRSSIDANGKSRMRNFRPRPDEYIDDFQQSKGSPHRFQDHHSPSDAKQKHHNALEFDRYRPNIHDLNVPPPPAPAPPQQQQPPTPPPLPTTPNQVEKGGFIPLLPGYKGFTPIKNPYAPSEPTSMVPKQGAATNERPSNTDSQADESMHASDNDKEQAANDDIENRYPLKVSTLAPSDVRATTYSSPSIDPIDDDKNVVDQIQIIPKRNQTISREPILAVTPVPAQTNAIGDDGDKHATAIERNEIRPTVTESSLPPPPPPRPPLLPSTPQITSLKPVYTQPASDSNNNVHQNNPIAPLTPNTSDVFNLSKNVNQVNRFDAPNAPNQTQNRNVLSALVAPGAQNIFRSGRPTITKVFSTSTASPITSLQQPSPQQQTPSKQQYQHQHAHQKSPLAPTLPLAEEYLRPEQQRPPLPAHPKGQIASSSDLPKDDMDWYFDNYNRSTNQNHADLTSLNRFRSSINGNNAACTLQINTKIITAFMILSNVVFSFSML